jgi:hypothetical protein
VKGHAERWASPSWRREATTWITGALAEQGITVTGEIEQPRIRFWATSLTVPTDIGRVWFKENHPSQAFEAALVDVISGVAPDHVIPVVAIEPSRGWLMTLDQGPTLREVEETQGPDAVEDHWVRVVREFGELQRRLSAHECSILRSGLPASPPEDEVALQRRRIAALVALDPAHPLHLDEEGERAAYASLPIIAAAADALAALPVPTSVDHNDLHSNNAFIPAGAPLRFFDFGDALWAHPFGTLFVPLRSVGRGLGGGDPRESDVGRRVIDAYLDVWDDLAPRDQLRSGVDAAMVLGSVHRSESWIRLAPGTPATEYEFMGSSVGDMVSGQGFLAASD